MTPSALAAGGRQAHRVTRSQIIEAIRRWHALYGEPPCSADWNPSIARWRAQEWRIARYAAGDPGTGEPWPSLNVVKRRFDGSFGAAVRAAGLEPHRPGPRRRAPPPSASGTPRPARPPPSAGWSSSAAAPPGRRRRSASRAPARAR